MELAQELELELGLDLPSHRLHCKASSRGPRALPILCSSNALPPLPPLLPPVRKKKMKEKKMKTTKLLLDPDLDPEKETILFLVEPHSLAVVVVLEPALQSALELEEGVRGEEVQEEQLGALLLVSPLPVPVLVLVLVLVCHPCLRLLFPSLVLAWACHRLGYWVGL